MNKPQENEDQSLRGVIQTAGYGVVQGKSEDGAGSGDKWYLTLHGKRIDGKSPRGSGHSSLHEAAATARKFPAFFSFRMKR